MRFLFAAALLMTACTGGRDPASAPPDVLFGVVAALTGPNASYGVPMRDGIALAIAQHGSGQGAVSGRPFRVIAFDDRSRASEAGLAAQKLVADEKVDVLLGEVSSSGSLAMAPIAERAHVSMISPSATEPTLTERGEYVFRVCFADPFQAHAMARFAKTTLAVEKVAVVRDLDSEYSVVLAKAFTDAFAKAGGKIALEGTFTHDEDFAALADKVAAAAPDAIYLPIYATEAAKLAAAVRAKKIGARILGADGFDASRLVEMAQLEGAHFTTHYAKEDNAAFEAAYLAAYNEEPGAIAALGYDAARVAIAALEKTGTSDKRAVRDAIAATKDFAGITGKITFDARRNAIKPAVIVAIEGGKRKLVTRMMPE